MDSTTLQKLRKLAEDGPPPPDGPQPAEPAAQEQQAVDPAREDEIRSATHAILGHALGTSVYDSGYASELADMVERLAKEMDVPPAEVVRVMRGTMERWRYVSKMTLTDGSQLNLGLRIEIK